MRSLRNTASESREGRHVPREIGMTDGRFEVVDLAIKFGWKDITTDTGFLIK